MTRTKFIGMLIGVVLFFLFVFVIPPIGAITPLGMRMLGVFLLILGISLTLGLDFNVWGRWFGSGFLIVIGSIIVFYVLYGLTRRRR